VDEKIIFPDSEAFIIIKQNADDPGLSTDNFKRVCKHIINHLKNNTSELAKYICILDYDIEFVKKAIACFDEDFKVQVPPYKTGDLPFCVIFLDKNNLLETDEM